MLVAIKNLIKQIQKKNIAEDMSETDLSKIGNDVCVGYDKDWDSMADWRNDIDAGLELIKPAAKGKSTPWEGAANFKTPILLRARQKFGDRASQELLQGNDLVKLVPVASDTNEKLEKRIERVQAVMNWQLTSESKGWIEQHDKLLYDISTQGDIFKKTYFSQAHGYNVSEVIKYPNFAIHQDTTCLEDAERFTHKQFFYARDIGGFMSMGIWREVDLKIKEDVDVVCFYEQQAWLDLDEDGIFEPYLITVHADTKTVVRIKAHFRIDNIMVNDEDDETWLLADLLVIDNGQPVIEDDDVKFSKEKLKAVKITRESNLTNYEFIKDPSGKFLSVGYFHLLGSYCTAINTTTNQLLDAGTMANLQCGFLAKGFRKRSGDLKIAPATWHQTDLSAQDLQNGIRLFDFKEPSLTLFQLNEKMGGEAEALAGILDIGDALGQNTTATTALSIIQEAQEANGAIILRIYRAMGHEYSVWYKLNSRYINPKQYRKLVNDDNVDPFADFSTTDLDVKPAANPQASSRIQRLAQAQAQIVVLEQVAATGGNPQPIVKEYLEIIGGINIDEVYPELTPEQKQAMQQEQQLQKQLQMAELQVNLEATKNIGDAQAITAQSRLIESQTKAHQAAKNIQKTDEEIKKLAAETFLTIERGETEATKNAVTIVNAENGMAQSGIVVEDDEYKKAQARKLNAEAQAQELENDLVESGMIDLLR